MLADLVRTKFAGLKARIRMLWVRVRHRRLVVIGQGVRFGGPVRFSGRGRIVLGDRVNFAPYTRHPTVIFAGPGATVTIGAGTWLNGPEILATKDVSIGDGCIFGSCWMATSHFHATERQRLRPDAVTREAPIVVGDDVWIAAQTAVLCGTTIGSGSVIGYGTVVSHDVDAATVVVSQQQRVVRRLD